MFCVIKWFRCSYTALLTHTLKLKLHSISRVMREHSPASVLGSGVELVSVRSIEVRIQVTEGVHETLLQ